MNDLREAVLTNDDGAAVRDLAERWVNAGDWHAVLAGRDAAKREMDAGDQRWLFADHYLTTVLCFGPPEFAVHALARPRIDVFERVAQAQQWDAIEPHLTNERMELLLAYHFVARGEDLTSARGLDSSRNGLPLRLEDWEPSYVFFNHAAGGGGAGPMTGRGTAPLVDLPPAGGPVEDDPVADALLAFSRGWVARSNGQAVAASVTGNAAQAISALGYVRAGVQPVSAQHALQQLALACATGGAYGGGQGVVRARVAVWNLMATLSGDAPAPPYRDAALAKRAAEITWFSYAPDVGDEFYIWELYLAAEAPAISRAWAIAATDND